MTAPPKYEILRARLERQRLRLQPARPSALLWRMFMLTAMRSRSLSVIFLVLLAQVAMRADAHIFGPSSFGVGGGWGSGGGLNGYLLHFGFAPGGGYYLHWTGNNWNSYSGDYAGSGSCCGYGQHQLQSTWASSSAIAAFQTDGNLVLYDGASVLWQTFTNGNNGGYLDLQDDRNLVVRNASNAPVWSLF
jgi:hypothetical protein